jgi:hypothetical protein
LLLAAAGGESIPVPDPPLAFAAWYTGKKTLNQPVVLTVTLPAP